MTFVLVKRESSGGEVYFKRARRRGGIEVVGFWSDAKHFSSKASALECADTHPELCNSDEWKPVLLSARCEKTGGDQ